MIAFEILDMTCGHCRAAITRAALGVDSTAEVEVDLAHHVARINSAEANSDNLAEAIVAAGYTPRRVELQDDDRTEPGASGCACANIGTNCGMGVGMLARTTVQPQAPGVQFEGRSLPRRHSCCSAGTSRCGS